jgi:hypothetical protein
MPITTYAWSVQLITFFLEPKNWANCTQNPWACLLINLVSKIPHGRQDCQRITIHCKESPSRPIHRRIKLDLFALRQSLGPRATGQSWDESSLHDISTTLDGRFLQDICKTPQSCSTNTLMPLKRNPMNS